MEAYLNVGTDPETGSGIFPAGTQCEVSPQAAGQLIAP